MKSNLKSEAIAAYERAASDPKADWRSVAELLRAAIPSARGGKASDGNGWADYAIGGYRNVMLPAPVAVVEYVDGETVRMSFASLPGKPLNVGRGLRVADAAHEIRMARKGYDVKNAVGLNRVVAMRVELNGVVERYFNAADVNTRTGRD